MGRGDRLVEEPPADRRTAIGALYLLSSTLLGAFGVRPVDHYLTAAEMLGTRATGQSGNPTNPLDLAIREAGRAVDHLVEVKKWLDLMLDKYQGENWCRIADVLFDFFGPDYIALHPLGREVESDECALDLVARDRFAQFLSADTNDELSDEHAKWLACLIWLEKRRTTVHLCKTGNALSMKFSSGVVVAPVNADVAHWAARF